MKITDSEKLTKRIRRKSDSMQLSLDLLSAFNKYGLKDSKIKKLLERQNTCSSKLEVYSNDVIRTWFCGQKTCRVCNSIRMAKLLGLYRDQIEQYPFIYHLTLTMENAYYDLNKKEIDKIIYSRNFIKNRIDDMFKFWHNSIMAKTDLYKKLSKTVKMIRSWEVTFNSVKTLHPHFHLLLVSDNCEDVETLGNFIINHWIKWWERKKIKCVKEAQMLSPIRKTILENFKYCLKISDIKSSNAIKIIQIINYTHNRRLFTQKGFKSEKELNAINKKDITEIEENKIDNINNELLTDIFLYNHELSGFYSEKTGEIIT